MMGAVLPGACGLCIQMYNDDRNSVEGCKVVQDRPHGIWLRSQALQRKSRSEYLNKVGKGEVDITIEGFWCNKIIMIRKYTFIPTNDIAVANASTIR